jgi:hypothetical protein
MAGFFWRRGSANEPSEGLAIRAVSSQASRRDTSGSASNGKDDAVTASNPRVGSETEDGAEVTRLGQELMREIQAELDATRRQRSEIEAELDATRRQRSEIEAELDATRREIDADRRLGTPKLP